MAYCPNRVVPGADVPLARALCRARWTSTGWASSGWTLLDKGLIADPGDITRYGGETGDAGPDGGEAGGEHLAEHRGVEAGKPEPAADGAGDPARGWEIATTLANHFHTLEAIEAASQEEIAEVEGIGRRSRRACTSTSTTRLSSRLRKLGEAGVNTTQHRPAGGGAAERPDVRVHGDAGGDAAGAGGEAGYRSGRGGGEQRDAEGVVRGGGGGPGSKLAKAQGYGITVLTEEEWVGLMREAGTEIG